MLGHGVVEVERPRLEHLPTAEGEELPGERRGARRRLADLHDVVAPRVRGSDRVEQELDVAADGGEQVVEVVRDAAGELADGLHLLRLAELRLQLGAMRTRR